ncbi:hypothetical protein NXS19_011429 [Fusarium pseudograminearum]|uniref:LrgB-like protein n=1 Tax=Fusarium pseudograminearum (strain CS3096) TaxID=1028729 RepID=K3VV91_FUSPC|nr:hypothetical protein FPSE_01724 [Fusarium pseudograminearum CS3096]EKJ78263.1 hypothetical protein FPSE_01724 [Fusarium pseudograminearum CS3096]UZP43617.1 hypothetical protein NXS19_011429 [Fusarium pseudograminearum]
MSTFRNNVSKILRCLSPSNEARTSRSTPVHLAKTLFQSTRDMSLSKIWKKRLNYLARNVLEFGWVVIIYLMSELIIWGLSRALAPINLEFFSSIFGMVLTFCCMAFAYLCFSGVDDVYQRHIKSKVDFINVHLGLGFPIPLVMLNQSDILGGHDIARIIGNFVVTNLASWVMVFAMSLLVMTFAARWTAQVPDDFCLPKSHTEAPPRIETSWLSDSTLDQLPQPMFSRREKATNQPAPDRDTAPSTTISQRSSIALKDPVDASSVWHLWTSNFPLLASFMGIFIVGAPIAAAANEDRILDGCVMWFIWALTLRLQREVRTAKVCADMPNLKNAIVTLMNPVLFTTLLMTAYTRAKAGAYGFGSLSKVLADFSSGTTLYLLWTSVATGTPLSDDRTPWFGAGDAALSILECGILIWGFKLYECQRQLFSLAGLLTVILATAAAAGNVFVSVLAGNLIGLDAPEALSFAARSTTLALAKPAMAALGGNLGVNAALVVSNGILGQLCYPFVLDKLGVKREDNPRSETGLSESDSRSSRLSLKPLLKSAQQDLASGDDPFTISAGIAVGINGAAMGVSYLYETKSRAAPYAALAMTVSGVMTVVFTTVEPFKGAVLNLAR